MKRIHSNLEKCRIQREYWGIFLNNDRGLHPVDDHVPEADVGYKMENNERVPEREVAQLHPRK